MEDPAGSAPPTAEELASAGVEVGVVSAAEPARAKFTQVDDLPDKPKTDVKIRLEDGTEFRERIARVPQTTGEILGAAPAGFNFTITNALLGPDGRIAVDRAGVPKITPPELCHEFNISGEDMGAMSAEQIEAALTHAREVAAAKHIAYFDGMAKGEAVFGDRLA